MDSKTELMLNNFFDRIRQVEAEIIDTRTFWFLLSWTIATFVYN